MQTSKSYEVCKCVVFVALKKFGFKEIAPEKALCDVSKDSDSNKRPRDQ